jgi:hypothetical protein
MRNVTLPALVFFFAFEALPAEPIPVPGLYRVEVRLELPNVPQAAAQMTLSRCLTESDLASGQAFWLLSRHPLQSCDRLDYETAGQTVRYRIRCPGPNRGHAVATFETKATAYRGRIVMNMGGKNMTMSETQVAARVGDCLPEGRGPEDNGSSKDRAQKIR